MKKAIFITLIIVFLLVALGTGGYFYLMETSKPVIRNELSERSKEFIASQTGKRDESWRSVDLDKKRAGESDFDSNRIQVKECYSVIVPFAVSDDRQNDPCVYYAILESPRGSMTTSLREVGFTKAEDTPDVTFRKGKKEQYQESSITGENGTFLVFTDKTTGTEKTAFGMIGGQLFTVSLSIGGDEEVKTRQMRKILDSVKLE